MTFYTYIYIERGDRERETGNKWGVSWWGRLSASGLVYSLGEQVLEIGMKVLTRQDLQDMVT